MTGPSYIASDYEVRLRAMRLGKKRRFVERAVTRNAEIRRKWHRRWQAAGYEFRIVCGPPMHFSAPGFAARVALP